MFPISDSPFSANVACLTGIGRVNQNQGYADLKSFVGQEFPELIESPTIDSPTLILPCLLTNIVSDSLKILKSNFSMDLPCSGHYGFADFMVNLSLVAALLSRKSLLKLATSASGTSCTFGSFLLKNCSHRLIVFLDFLNSLPAKLLTLRSYSNIGNTKINTKNLIGLDRLRGFIFGLNIDVALRAFLAKRGTGRLGTSEHIPLIVTKNQLDPLPGSQEGYTNLLVLLSEGKDPSIVVDAGRFKVLDNRIVEHSSLAITSNPVDSSDHEVSRQPELRPDILVNKVVDHHAISQICRYGLIDPVTSISKSLQSVLYLGYLIWGRCKLATCGQYKFSHLEVVSYMTKYLKSYTGKRTQFLLPPEGNRSPW